VSRAYLSVEQAVAMPGLRIAFSRGVPGPWSEAARAFFDLKRIDYVAVEQDPGGPNEALIAWTGQRLAPVAMLDDERPRTHWSELLLLAERLSPEPRLIPRDAEQRAIMFGLSHEICGEDGFGWAVRQLLMDNAPPTQVAGTERMRQKFCSPATQGHLSDRATSVMALLAHRLDAQEKRGSGYLIGDALSAVDIYWTTFSNLVSSMPREICPMPDFYIELAINAVRLLGKPAPDILIGHRDRILADHFIPPMWF
jgi:glutathione S-transferase